MKLQLPFRNEQNQRFSKQLFYELWKDLSPDQRIGEPPFTLNVKRDGFVCFREEYIRDADPTGYKTSTKLLGDFNYWKHLLKAGWFRESVSDWNDELDAKLQAEAFDKIRDIAAGDDAKALNAAKFIANKEYKKTINRRGRPSKEEVEGRLVEEAASQKAVEEDFARIRVVK